MQQTFSHPQQSSLSILIFKTFWVFFLLKKNIYFFLSSKIQAKVPSIKSEGCFKIFYQNQFYGCSPWGCFLLEKLSFCLVIPTNMRSWPHTFLVLTKADFTHVPNIKSQIWASKSSSGFSLYDPFTCTHLFTVIFFLLGRQNAASISEPGDLCEFPKQKSSTNQSKLTCHISSKQGAWWYLHVRVGLEQCSPWEPRGCSAGADRSRYQAECSEECRTGSGPEQCCNPTL